MEEGELAARNVASARVALSGGREKFIAAVNRPATALRAAEHSEARLARVIERYNRRFGTRGGAAVITDVFSERAFCGEGWAGCQQIIQQSMPHADLWVGSRYGHGDAIVGFLQRLY
jgi:hypothetical protein